MIFKEPWKTRRCFRGGQPSTSEELCVSCSPAASPSAISTHKYHSDRGSTVPRIMKIKVGEARRNLYQVWSAAFTLLWCFKNRRWRSEHSLSSQAVKPGKDNHPCCFRPILLNRKLKWNVILDFVRVRAKTFLSPIFNNNQLQRQSQGRVIK